MHSDFLRQAGIAAIVIGISTSFAAAQPTYGVTDPQPTNTYDPYHNNTYDPQHRHGCDPGRYVHGWNHKVCKHLGYADIVGGKRLLIEHYDGSYLYSDHNGMNHWSDPHLLTESCRHGKAGYDVWVDDPRQCKWGRVRITY